MKMRLNLNKNKLEGVPSDGSMGVSLDKTRPIKNDLDLKPSLRTKLLAPRNVIALLFLVLVFLGVNLFMDLSNKRSFVEFDTSWEILAQEKSLVSAVEAVSPGVYQVRDKENPVNGIMITSDELDEIKSRKLVVVSLNNHEEARPQFGLSQADLVLEVLAEGGITRYNAFYYQNQNVEKIGPIRSARSYMLEFFMGFDDPVFVHEGQASYPPHERAVPEINTLVHLSQWGIESMQTAASRYRDPERVKSAGYVHSLMTGFDLINKEIDRLGWRKPSDIEPLKFKFDASSEERGASSVIEVRFTSLATSSYSNKFEYDPITNTYLRSVGGKADVDALNSSRIAPKNVIVEYHDYADARDGHSRIILDMIGEDEAFIFRDGQMIKGKWVKASREERTKYFDETGQEIVFNRGQIWVVNAAKTSTKRISEVVYNGSEL